jgi:hypothetical protein
MSPRPLALLPLVGLVLSACGGDDPNSDYDPNADMPSCAETRCVAETNALAKDIAEVSGVARVNELRYVPDQITDGPHIGGEVVLSAGNTRADCDALEGPFGRLLWESNVAPVDGLTVTCRAPGTDDAGYVSASWVLEPATFRDKWGPRTGR